MPYKQLSLSFVLLLTLLFLPAAAAAQQACFTPEARAQAERTAKVYREPDPGYDPVLGFNPIEGPRRGAPTVDANGVAQAISCFANKDDSPGSGTTPKFHCSVRGNVDEDGELIRYKVKPHFKDSRETEGTARFMASFSLRVFPRRWDFSPMTNGWPMLLVLTVKRV